MHTPAAERDIHAENWARYTDKKNIMNTHVPRKKKRFVGKRKKKSWLKQTFLSPPPLPP